MAFFDELGKALSDTGKVVVGKTKDITGALQLKAKVSQEKDKVNQAYIELGKAFYDILKTAPEETYASEVKTISEGLLVIEDLENQIMELEGTRICAECGAKVDRGAKFCSKCGTPLPEMPPKEGPNPAQDWADVGKAADDCVKAATDMARLQDNPNVTITAVPGATLNQLVINSANFPQFTPEVRRALHMAIDTEAITKTAYVTADRADSLLPPSAWGYKAVDESKTAFDPEGARHTGGLQHQG